MFLVVGDVYAIHTSAGQKYFGGTVTKVNGEEIPFFASVRE